MSHLGAPLANNKSEDGDDDNHGDSTPFPLLPCIQPRCTTPHKARKSHGDGENGKRRGIPTGLWRGTTRIDEDVP